MLNNYGDSSPSNYVDDDDDDEKTVYYQLAQGKQELANGLSSDNSANIMHARERLRRTRSLEALQEIKLCKHSPVT